MLQAVLFGYGGIRQRRFYMEADPHILPEASSWKIQGLDYRGFVLNLDIQENELDVTLMDDSADDEKLILWDEVDMVRYELVEGETLTVNRGKVIFVTETDENHVKPPGSAAGHVLPEVVMVMTALAAVAMVY